MSYYNIYCRGRKIHGNVPEEEMLEILHDFSDQFHSTGEPDPDDLDVEIILEDGRTRYLTN